MVLFIKLLIFSFVFKIFIFILNNIEENIDHYVWAEAINNNNWTIEADQQIVQWFNTAPHDWQPYTKCDAYLWGNGRNGQLGDTGMCNRLIKINYAKIILFIFIIF